MSNNKSWILIALIGGAALWAALSFFPQEPESPVPQNSPAELPLPASGAVSSNPATLTTPPPLPPQQGLPLLGPHLHKIGECLNIQNALNEVAPLSFASLEDSLRGEFGELEFREMDWKNIHLTLPNGEKRRLRLEFEGSGEASSALRLRHYSVDKEDLPVPLPLAPEQSLNPSEAFIASLENEGQVTLREEASRGNYSNGAELSYTERNGALSEFEINHAGKSIKCQELQSPQGRCHCF